MRAGAAARWARWFVVLGVTFGVYFAADRHMNLPSAGDEPHYELEAYSLLLDGDRDLTNDYRDHSRFRHLFGPVVPDVHARRFGKSRALVSIHNVGLPLLLVPAAALGRHSTYWFHFEMALIAALAACVLLSILERLRLARPFWTYVVWASVAFSVPLLMFAGQAYPELPGALLALLAIRALVSRPFGRREAILGAVAASLMPWLHVRFAPISLILVALLAARALSIEPDAARGIRDLFRRDRLRTNVVRVGWAAVPLVVSLGAMAIAFQHWYGSPALDAQYQGGQPALFSHPDFTYFWFFGGLFSRDHGWVPLAPVTALGIAGIGFLCWRFGRWAVVGTVLVFAYLLFATSGGIAGEGGFTAGYSFYWRYHLIVVPLVAIPLLFAVARVRVLRFAIWPLIALTFALTIQAVDHPLVLFYLQTRVGLEPVPLMVRLGPAWPDFVMPGRHYPSVAHLAVVLYVLSLIGALLVPARDDRPAGGVRRLA